MSISGAKPTIKDFDHTRGPQTASLQMMCYGSYQCPKTGQAHQAIKTLHTVLGDRFCFTYRHFPRTDLHSQSHKAAETAEAAASQGKFWEMHDKLFDNQELLDDASLVEYADQLGLNIEQFLQDLGEHAHANQIETHINSGLEDGVTETPTFLVSVRHEGTANLAPFLQMLCDLMTMSSNSASEA